ncbi:hypothetical protein [Streptomyces sp. SYSU K217416]
MKTAAFVVVVWAGAALLLRFESGAGWEASVLLGAVVAPLALWMGWLRRRMNERAREWGRRRTQPWPDEKR